MKMLESIHLVHFSCDLRFLSGFLEYKGKSKTITKPGPVGLPLLQENAYHFDGHWCSQMCSSFVQRNGQISSIHELTTMKPKVLLYDWLHKMSMPHLVIACGAAHFICFSTILAIVFNNSKQFSRRHLLSLSHHPTKCVHWSIWLKIPFAYYTFYYTYDSTSDRLRQIEAMLHNQ